MSDVPGLAGLGEGRKGFVDGTHRVVAPEHTIARVLPFAGRMGITRVANLTGLDTLGVPVAAAYRPNSRSIAVFQGKGTTLAAAKASALMEAAEAWHAEHVAAPRLVGRCADLAARGVPVVDPARLPLAPGSGGDPRSAELRWLEGRDLFTGAAQWVPFDLVTADYSVDSPADGPLQGTTNGLASGNDLLEAINHALYEAIERDAVARWRLIPDRAQDATTLDLGTAGPGTRALVDRFAAAGVALRAFDVTSDIGVPAVLCLAVAGGDDLETHPELGSGCHADPSIALSRAITEAAQVRLSRISGARDDLAPESYDASHRAVRAEAARAWLLATPQGDAARDCRSLASCAGATLRQDLEATLGRLAAAGFDQAVWVDLTHPEIGLPVVRVIVPGLEGPPTAGRQRGAHPRHEVPSRSRAPSHRRFVRFPPGTDTVVFLGPTMPAAEAARLLPGARILPPARQGDIYRAVLAERPRAIALIDGRFATVPAVWHREILWAMGEAGVAVLGAASMGALRAAELDRFGMVGVGKIHEAYRTGCYPPFADPFEDDDEVAISHAPPAAASVPLSCAMVDIRETLAAAEAAGVIGPAVRDRLAAVLKRLHFPERSLARLASAAAAIPGEGAALADRLRSGLAVSQKRRDAEALLSMLANGLESRPPTAFTFERVEVWERFVATAGPVEHAADLLPETGR